MFRLILNASLFFLISIAASRSALCQISDEMTKSDARLSKRVSFASNRIYLKDLFAELTKMTGVSLKTNDQDMAPAIELSVRFEELPLAKVLDSVWSLISNTDSKYSFVRGGTPSSYAYYLIEPYFVKSRAGRIRDYSNKLFENYINDLCNMSLLSATQSRNRIKAYLNHKTEDEVKMILAILDSESTRNEISLFSELVPVEKRHSVLFEGLRVEIATTQATQRVQSLYNLFWTSMFPKEQVNTATSIAPALPDRIEIYVKTFHKTDIIPEVVINHEEGVSGTLISSFPVETEVKRVLKQRWKLLLDEWTCPYEDSKLTETSKYEDKTEANSLQNELRLHMYKAQGLTDQEAASKLEKSEINRQNSRPMDGQMSYLAKMMKFPYFAVFDSNSKRMPIYPKGTLLSKVLGDSDGRFTDKMHKWREGVLLVNSPKWFASEPATTNFDTLKLLLGSKDGIVEMEKLAKAVSRMNDEQASELMPRFPVLREAYPMRQLFIYAQLHPAALQPDGVEIDTEMADYLGTKPKFGYSKGVDEASARRIRLRQFVPDPTKPRNIVIRPELLVEDKWVSLGGFIQIPVQKVAPK